MATKTSSLWGIGLCKNAKNSHKCLARDHRFRKSGLDGFDSAGITVADCINNLSHCNPIGAKAVQNWFLESTHGREARIYMKWIGITTKTVQGSLDQRSKKRLKLLSKGTNLKTFWPHFKVWSQKFLRVEPTSTAPISSFGNICLSEWWQ